MEHIDSDQSLDVTNRAAVDRDDIKTHTLLFQRDVEGLLRRDSRRFLEICKQRGIEGDVIDDLKEKLTDLFRSETHYKRRNKLRDQVTKIRY